jgi:hypothetical protein
LEGLAKEDVGIINGHLGYFTDIWAIWAMAIWYNLWQFCFFFRVGILYQDKSGNPGLMLEELYHFSACLSSPSEKH